MKTLQDFITLKGSNTITDAQLKFFGLERKQLTSGWLKRLRNTPLKDQDSWEQLAQSVKPSCVGEKSSRQKVYIIKNCIGDYKIGISSDVSVRFKDLLVGNSEPMEVVRLYRVNTPKKAEKTLHTRYGSIRKRGEWFSRELDLKDVDVFVREGLVGCIEYSNETDKVWIVS